MSNQSETSDDIAEIRRCVDRGTEKAWASIANFNALADSIGEMGQGLSWVVDALNGMNDRLARLEAATTNPKGDPS